MCAAVDRLEGKDAIQRDLDRLREGTMQTSQSSAKPSAKSCNWVGAEKGGIVQPGEVKELGRPQSSLPVKETNKKAREILFPRTTSASTKGI